MHLYEQLLGDEVEELLSHDCKKISKHMLNLPGGDVVDRLWLQSDRSTRTIKSLNQLYMHGRLGGTGYLSILPVDQGIEHSAGAAFAANPIYFDSENIVRLALEGGCSAVASSFGVLRSVARKYAHKIPFIVKLNHNELLSYPNKYDQILFGTVKEAWDMGAVAVGATIYFGSTESKRQITDIAIAFSEAHRLGMATILWCYVRNDAFKKVHDHNLAADITAQANYLGATVEADIIKQKIPTHNGGFIDLKFSKTDKKVYEDLTTNHPIDLVRYQVANCFLGRIGLLNSGGESKGSSDLKDLIRESIINKRAGGIGVIAGRKIFQRSMTQGISYLNAIQDIYLNPNITIA